MAETAAEYNARAIAEYNARAIGDFRTNAGRAGGAWEGTLLLRLHRTGARSRASRVNPAWCHNLKAQPNATIDVGSETSTSWLRRRRAASERLFARGAKRFPQIAEYARKTQRVIPVIVLTPRGAPERPSPRSTRPKRSCAS